MLLDDTHLYRDTDYVLIFVGTSCKMQKNLAPDSKVRHYITTNCHSFWNDVPYLELVSNGFKLEKTNLRKDKSVERKHFPQWKLTGIGWERTCTNIPLTH